MRVYRTEDGFPLAKLKVGDPVKIIQYRGNVVDSSIAKVGRDYLYTKDGSRYRISNGIGDHGEYLHTEQTLAAAKVRREGIAFVTGGFQQRIGLYLEVCTDKEFDHFMTYFREAIKKYGIDDGSIHRISTKKGRK